MEIIKNNRGGEKLCLDGFMFTKKNTKKSTIRWECSERRALSCKGSLTTDLNVEIAKGNTEHSHPPNNSKVEAIKLMSTIKQNATTVRGHTSQILADAVSTVPVEVRVELGKTDTVKRRIRRTKRSALPAEPASLQDLTFDEEWATTGGADPEPFLIHDSGPDSQHRVVVFGTEGTLRHLARSHLWYMDGTFQTAPRLFTQMYVIRVPLGQSAVTCIYAFLTGKSQALYEELLNAICNKCEQYGFNPDPATIIMDFEDAMCRAIIAALGEHVAVKGCFYHLTQSTWRKIQSLGLVQEYRDNEAVRLFCGMIDGLAFLPVDKVSDGMQYLRENTPEGSEELLDYFDATYVSGSFRQVQPPAADPDADVPPFRMRRLPPRFLPAQWNVHDATLSGESRTNNFCEGWNNGYKELVGHAHPGIWIALDSIRKDHSLVAAALYEDARGQPPAKRVKRATVQLQDRLRNLCQQFRDETKSLKDFLRGIGHIIRWK